MRTYLDDPDARPDSPLTPREREVVKLHKELMDLREQQATMKIQLDAALKEKRTHLSDDWEALVRHPAIDIIIESTGNPPAAVEHALAAFRNLNPKHEVPYAAGDDPFLAVLEARRLMDSEKVAPRAGRPAPSLSQPIHPTARRDVAARDADLIPGRAARSTGQARGEGPIRCSMRCAG